MPLPFFVQLLIGFALSLISYLLFPGPKQPKPEAARDLDNPTAEAGRPIPVPFGTMTITGLNILHFSDKSLREYNVDA